MNQKNADQSDAIRHPAGPCVVIAPPGSGKTFTLVNRIQYLTHEAGIMPEHILVITFTKAAANEMKSRYLSLADQADTQITFGTFHAVFFHMLRSSMPEYYPSDSVLTEDAGEKILTRILYSLPYEREELPKEDRILSEISIYKKMKTAGEKYHSPLMDDELLDTIAKRYFQTCQSMRKIDFDDMAFLCGKMLREHEEIRKEWQNRYRYILVDEFQDIDRQQFEVLRILAEPERNLFLVGDDDQSIYGFRGADPAIMLSLEKEYPDIRKISLKINYRSGQKIIDAALRLIGHNQIRFAKEVRAAKRDFGKVSFHKFQTVKDEETYIVRCLERWREAGEAALDETAVITRTNVSIAQYAALFTVHNIAFRCMEKTQNLFEHPVVSDIHAYLRLSQGEASRGDFLRVMNCPDRHLSRKELLDVKDHFLAHMKARYAGKRYMREILMKFSKDMECIRGLPPYAAINYIRKGIGYEEYIKMCTGEQNHYEEAMRALYFVQESARGFQTYEEYISWFTEKKEDHRMQISHINGQSHANAQTPLKEAHGVRLMTMHGSKGLEYQKVILPDLNEKNIPHRKAFLPKEIEEERRLLYVAMTRAREELVLTGIESAGNQKKKLSRFIKELYLHSETDSFR